MLQLGTRVEDFVVHGHGVSVGCRQGARTADETGIALICADGLWSRLRLRLGHAREARVPPAHRLAGAGSRRQRSRRSAHQTVRLWLGHGAHLVHYPVKAGALINIVAIVDDRWDRPGWSEPGERDEIVARFATWRWAKLARELIATPERWHKWALYDLPPLKQLGRWAGDAARGRRPPDAAVPRARRRDGDRGRGGAGGVDGAHARRHCRRDAALRARAAAGAPARRSAARGATAGVYHLAAAEAVLRNLTLRAIGGKMLLRSYDWLYDWRPTPPKS